MNRQSQGEPEWFTETKLFVRKTAGVLYNQRRYRIDASSTAKTRSPVNTNVDDVIATHFFCMIHEVGDNSSFVNLSQNYDADDIEVLFGYVAASSVIPISAPKTSTSPTFMKMPAKLFPTSAGMSATGMPATIPKATAVPIIAKNG